MSLLLMLIGGIMMLYSIIFLVEAISSKYWPTETGKIISSEIVKEISGGTEYGDSIMYRPSISFSYRVDNIEYISTQVKPIFNYTTNWSARSKRWVKKYPKDKIVKVYYPANHPENGTLEPGVSLEMIAIVSIGLLLFTLSYLYYFHYELIFRNLFIW